MLDLSSLVVFYLSLLSRLFSDFDCFLFMSWCSWCFIRILHVWCLRFFIRDSFRYFLRLFLRIIIYNSNFVISFITDFRYFNAYKRLIDFLTFYVRERDSTCIMFFIFSNCCCTCTFNFKFFPIRIIV